MDWGICTTLKAPPDRVLAFVAWHLSLGPARIWLHFDDPEDPAADLVAALPQVTAIRCDDAWWKDTAGRRPDKHQNRQSSNIHRLCNQAPLPWIAHIDADEFLLPRRPIGQILDKAQDDALIVRARPWEALHDQALPDDIFTARAFRGPMAGAALARIRAEVFGDYAHLFPQGVLSHAAGKCFFRTGVPGFEPRIHGAILNGRRVTGVPFHPDLELLHFHAQDREDWLSRLPFRLDRGAYIGKPELFAWAKLATPDEIGRFYAETQTATPQMLARLRAHGLLIETDLHLLDHVARLTEGL